MMRSFFRLGGLLLFLLLFCFVSCRSSGDEPLPAPDTAASAAVTEAETHPITELATTAETQPETVAESETAIESESATEIVTESETELETETEPVGLDITDKSDLVGICYSVWFDYILGSGTVPVENWANITEILAGNQNWGGPTQFHYWAKPFIGYYRSSDRTVIRRHMTQLYRAGVDFITPTCTTGTWAMPRSTSVWSRILWLPCWRP